jgi:sec-independent protein translocase protein TatA
VFEGAFSPMHWLIVLLIVMVLFGGKKLPELGKGMGEAIRGFKKAMHEDDEPKASLPENSTKQNH